jgi:hypothetical protein
MPWRWMCEEIAAVVHSAHRVSTNWSGQYNDTVMSIVPYRYRTGGAELKRRAKVRCYVICKTLSFPRTIEHMYIHEVAEDVWSLL